MIKIGPSSWGVYSFLYFSIDRKIHCIDQNRVMFNHHVNPGWL